MRPARSISAAAVALGAAFDRTVNGPRPGIAVPVLVAAAAIAFRATAPRTPQRDLLLVAAAGFSTIFAWRNEAAVLGPAFVAVAGLLALAVTDGSARELTVAGAVERSLALARGTFRAPGFLAAPFRRSPDAAGSQHAVRAAALSTGIVGVFAMLFASADQVFADALVPKIPFPDAAGHVFIAAIGAVLAGVMWAATSGPNPQVRIPRIAGRITPLEWTAALSALTALFALFVGVQLAFLFGGRSRIDVTPGLTYAEYARSGFFQLLVAGALTIVVLLGAWDLGERPTAHHRRRFLLLASALTGLCLVVLASAATRLALYQDAFGFTTSRVGAWLAIGGIGAGLIGLVAAIAWDRRRNVLAGGIVIVLSLVLGAAIVSPSAFVARRNIERLAATGKIDVPYLTTLGPEAAPALVRLVPRLSAEDRELLRSELCAHVESRRDDWRSWNASIASALRAVATLDCGDRVP